MTEFLIRRKSDGKAKLWRLSIPVQASNYLLVFRPSTGDGSRGFRAETRCEMGREALKGSGPKTKARDWRKYRDRCPSVKTMGWGWRSFEASLLIILLQHIGWRKQHIPKSLLTVQVNTKCTHLSILSENIFYRGLIKGKVIQLLKQWLCQRGIWCYWRQGRSDEGKSEGKSDKKRNDGGKSDEKNGVMKEKWPED